MSGLKFLSFEEVASHPDRVPRAMGTKGLTEYRRQKVPHFPFGILYRVGEGVIEVVGIAHERRRPGYWAKR